MRNALLSTILLMTYTIHCFEVENEYHLQLFPTNKRSTKYAAHPILDFDHFSGCTCTYQPKIKVTCTGKEKCTYIPRKLKEETTFLSIINTKISAIKKNDFEDFYTNLIHLEINDNEHLEKIEEASFKKLTKLRILSISNNKLLTSLKNKTFEGLNMLHELILENNGFTNLIDIIQSLAVKYLPTLRNLVLSKNQFTQINENDFSALHGNVIKELTLMGCQINNLHSDSLNVFKNLRTLRLSNNIFKISALTDLLKSLSLNGIPLYKLNLYGINFGNHPPKELLEVISNSNISTLNLGGNNFEYLTSDSFPLMPKITSLDLSFSRVIYIEKNTFNNFPNLRTLLLQNTKLLYTFDDNQATQLGFLDLSYSAAYFAPGINNFSKLTTLWGLNLGYNGILHIFPSALTGLISLEILILRGNNLQTLDSFTFVSLKKLKYLDMSINLNLVKTNPLNNTSFAGLNNLQVLLLGECNITWISAENNPFENLTSLKFLSLENNHISTLSPQLFLPLKYLAEVNISQNSLKPWFEPIFANNTIHYLQMSANKLTTITKAMLQDFSYLKDIDISNNPFICECPLVSIFMENTILYNNQSLVDCIKNKPPSCSTPTEYNNKTIIDFYEMVINNDDLCDLSSTKTVIKYTLIAIFLLVLSFIIFVFAYKFRWHIRYWIFLTKISIIRQGRILRADRNACTKIYDFDAFVSYSNEDRDFVIRMVDNLEKCEPFLKLCVYERDFQIGDVISESILESVAKSRKTVLIVSNSYVKSHWCRWEAQVAENYRLFFQNENGDLVNDSIIVIKLGKVDRKNMPPMLKYLTKTRIYMEWENDASKQEQFFKTLRKNLTAPCSLNVCPNRSNQQTSSNERH